MKVTLTIEADSEVDAQRILTADAAYRTCFEIREILIKEHRGKTLTDKEILIEQLLAVIQDEVDLRLSQ